MTAVYRVSWGAPASPPNPPILNYAWRAYLNGGFWTQGTTVETSIELNCPNETVIRVEADTNYTDGLPSTPASVEFFTGSPPPPTPHDPPQNMIAEFLRWE